MLNALIRHKTLVLIGLYFFMNQKKPCLVQGFS